MKKLSQNFDGEILYEAAHPRLLRKLLWVMVVCSFMLSGISVHESSIIHHFLKFGSQRADWDIIKYFIMGISLVVFIQSKYWILYDLKNAQLIFQRRIFFWSNQRKVALDAVIGIGVQVGDPKDARNSSVFLQIVRGNRNTIELIGPITSEPRIEWANVLAQKLQKPMLPTRAMRS